MVGFSVEVVMSMVPLNSAENVLKILFVWSENQSWELGLTEISRLTGINKSTVYKILLTLRDRNLISLNPENKKYHLDVGILELSNIFLKNLSLRDIAHPLLKELAQESGKTVTFALRKEEYLVFIDRVDGAENVRFYCDVGKVIYYNDGAAAKAVFAHLPEQQIRVVTKTEEKRFTENTRTWKELLKEADTIRTLGYSVSDEEVDRGVIAVGAPVFDQHGSVIAGVAVATLKQGLPKKEFKRMASLVMKYAKQISIKLGYVPAK